MSNHETTAKKSSSIITIALGVALIVMAMSMPGVGIFTAEMIRTMCLIVLAIMFWVKQPIPIIATSLLVVVLMPLAKLTPSLNAAFSGFINPAHYFVIASFAFGMALQKTSLCTTVVKKFVQLSKGKIRMVALLFMILTFVISMFVSDITAVIIGIAFVMDIANLITDEAEKRRTLKLLLLALPFASVLGGAASAVGSSVNVIAVNLLNQHYGLDVTFVQWLVLGFPVTIVTLFACWAILVTIHKANDIPYEFVQQYVDILDKSAKEKKTKKEPITLIVLGAIIVAWVLSSWVKVLDATSIAIIGMALLFMPGVRACTWEDFKKNMAWEIPIMGGVTISLGEMAIKHGLIDMIVDFTTTTFSGVGLFGLIALLTTLVTILLIAVPVGPAMVSMLAIPAYIMAQTLGFNPIVALVVVGMFASNSSILPLNSVYLVSYTKGYWKTGHLIPVGAAVSVVWIVLTSLWMTIISGVVF